MLLFFLQLIVSFIIGGCAIAFLLLVAERASTDKAGIIISLPSIIVISYFFMGWTLSPSKISSISGVVPAALGISLLFVCAYVYLSKVRLPRKQSMMLCISISFLCWFALAIPFALIKFSRMKYSLIIYCVCFGISYYLLTIRPGPISENETVIYTFRQKIGRAIFCGFMISVAVFCARVFGPFWGGIFSVFPSAYSAGLIILHSRYASSFLFKMSKNIPIGSLTVLFYAIVAKYMFPVFGILIGTLLSFVVSICPLLIMETVKTMIQRFSPVKP